MSWEITRRLRLQLQREHGAIVKDPGCGAQVAIVFPNTYAVGMGNLAVHALYRLLNDRSDVVCERAFLPGKQEIAEYRRTKTALMTCESQRPLAAFDIVAFTCSFENDELWIPSILELANIPPRAIERTDRMPLVIAGGAAPTLNPAPLSQICDAIVLGEAESFVDDLFPLLASRLPKTALLDALCQIDGIFVPARQASPAAVHRRWIADLDAWPVQTVIHSADAEFGNMHLIELQRGCPFRCRFCATPALFHPPRHRSASAVIRMVDEGIVHRKRFGLIGTHILSHPEFSDIAHAIHERGATFSPSSIRAEDIDDEKAALLAQSGHRSVALGIEAGSEPLRNSLGKNLSDARIHEAIIILARHGITKLRLYFMIGLPGETEGNIASIAVLARHLRDALRTHAPRTARQTAVDLTLSSFIPKRHTPLAHAAFAGVGALRKKIASIKHALRTEQGIAVTFDPVREAAIEAALSTGDADTLDRLWHAGHGATRLLTSR